jgi:hypothetical protein
MGFLEVFGGIFPAKESCKLNHLDKSFSVGDVLLCSVIK